MNTRRKANALKHRFTPSGLSRQGFRVCVKCDQLEPSWMHSPKISWWQFWKTL